MHQKLFQNVGLEITQKRNLTDSHTQNSIYIYIYIYIEQLEKGITSKNTNFPD